MSNVKMNAQAQFEAFNQWALKECPAWEHDHRDAGWEAWQASHAASRAALVAALPRLHPQPADMAEQQGAGITTDWVLGYLNTDAPEDSREAIRNAFTEWNALAETGKQHTGVVQVDARAMLLQFGEEDLREGSRSNGHDGVDHGDWVDYIEVPVDVLNRIAAALAARQPGAQVPYGFVLDWKHAPAAFTTKAGIAAEHRDYKNCNVVPVYRAPPAQGIDLGRIVEQIAQQWDDCTYDAVGETIDIGEAIRAAGKRLAGQRDAAPGVSNG